jgi:hypothetical protein
MVDFDKFEKNVKNNYGNQEFPFDEANWEKAAKLIDASRKGKNRGGIFFLSAVAILCTTGLVYYFGFSDNSNVLKGKDLATNSVNTAKQNDNTGNPVQVTSENNSSVNNEENTKISTSSVADKNTSESNINNISSENSSNTTKNNSSLNNRNTSGKSVTEKSVKENNVSNPTNTTKPEGKPNSTKTSSSGKESQTNSDHVSTPKNNAVIASETQNSTPPVSGSDNNVTQGNPRTATDPIVASTPANNERTGTVEPDNKSGVVKNNDPVVTDTTIGVFQASVKPSKSGIDTLPKMSKGRADSLAAMMPKGDGISYATNVKVEHNAKNILFMEAGATYLLGWHGSGKNEAGGFNILAGVNFQHYFTGNMAAQIGVLYNTIDNLSNTSHTISTVKYDLGVEQDVTSIRYEKLHYVVAPIKLTFNVKENNIFTVGCNIAYLLNSDSRKEKYKTYSSDPNATKNNLTSTKETGYVKGFNPYDIQITAGYRRKIYKGLSANAEFFYGLTDTKDNTFFRSNNFDRNVGFKVSLCYDLFKK